MSREMPPKAKEFHAKAKEFLTASGGQLVLIERNSPEHRAWEKYFRVQWDWMPWGMKQMQLGWLETVTMPAQFPELFDPHFAALEPEEIERRYAAAIKPKPWIPPVVPNNFQQMVEKYGRPIGRFEEGTKWAHMAGRDANPNKQISGGASDAELRERYSKRIAS